MHVSAEEELEQCARETRIIEDTYVPDVCTYQTINELEFIELILRPSVEPSDGNFPRLLQGISVPIVEKGRTVGDYELLFRRVVSDTPSFVSRRGSGVREFLNHIESVCVVYPTHAALPSDLDEPGVAILVFEESRTFSEE